MIVLVIDTAARYCQAALYDVAAGRLVAARTDDIGRGHAERLMDMIAETMKDARLAFEALGGVCVTVGPGSFTGIRVGVAAARGIALTRPFAASGVTTLQTLATQATRERLVDAPFAVAIDGGRGQTFVQHFHADASPIGAPRAVDMDNAPGAIAADVTALVGNAAALIAGRLDRAVSVHIDRPVGTVEAVARAAMDHPVVARPLYLRGADARPQTGFALPRAARTERAP